MLVEQTMVGQVTEMAWQLHRYAFKYKHLTPPTTGVAITQRHRIRGIDAGYLL
jgi:hypothetical protein